MDNKKCTGCGIILTDINCKEYNFANCIYICLICQKKKSKENWQKNKEQYKIDYQNNIEYEKERNRIYRHQLKLTVIEGYGGKCTCCGESGFESLSIDHVKNNGSITRAIYGSGTGLYRMLIKTNFPKDEYQLLCFNLCCPHNHDSEKECVNCSKFITNDYKLQDRYDPICLECFECKVKLICEDKKNKRNWGNAQSKKRKNIKVKNQIIENYGGKCVCCGETTFEFLTIDHINNNGAEDRRKYGSGTLFYKWVIENNFPKEELQLLCSNCNLGKAFYGACSHVKAKQLDEIPTPATSPPDSSP